MPKPGESLPGCKIVPGCGGKGANPAVAIARLGGKAAVIGKIGKDIYGQQLLENFKQYDTDLQYLFETDEAGSGIAVAMIEKSAENRIIGALGANKCLTRDDVRSAVHLISHARVLLCNFEVSLEATRESLILAKEHGVFTILNAAPALSNPDKDFYTLPDIFCVNEIEAEMTTGMSIHEDGYEKISEELSQRGCQTVVLTLGGNGIYVHSKSRNISKWIEACQVVPVDTTGAGDAFVGALAFYIAYYDQLPLLEQIRRASYIASCSVQKPGTQPSYPTKNELPKELF